MRSPRLAALELKRFTRGRMPRAALVAMVLLPLLYGALYLWSFWDPYERLDRIPVALVNEDEGTAISGEKLHVGDSIVEALHDSDTFDWRETDAADAREGVEDGRYYLSLTMPSDFSKKVGSASGDEPDTGALQVRSNDASNYIVGQISRTVFSEVRAAASSKVSRGFYDRIYLSFSTLHGKTTEAAEGADELGSGIGRAKSGAGELDGKLGELHEGTGDLKSGTSELRKGAGKLKKGSAQVAEGTGELAGKVNKAADALRPVLDEHGDEIGKTARGVARASKELKDDLGALPREARKAESEAQRAAKTLAVLERTRCGEDSTDPECPALKKAVDAAERSAEVASDVNDFVADQAEQRNLDRLGERLDDLHGVATLLADRAPALGDDLDSAVRQIDKLDRGAQQVSKGASRLHTGLASADRGAGEVDEGAGRLQAGAGELKSGLVRLSEGSGELSTGLHEGAEQIPDLGDEERNDRTGPMSDPVDLESEKAHAAPNYGTGFAPYFIPLALWVGAMIAYMLLPPLSRRALAAGAPAWRIALAGWLPVAGLGVAQAGALLAVLHWGLGLQLARGAGTVGFLLLVTACFTAIVQFLNARFGPAGRILVLAMLMLQLTSAGGTYPIQTSPEFFNALHPFLPMSYVVEGLRHLITGGGLGPVWQACGVLAAYAAGALALTAWTARRRQVWTVDRLHPELAL
ncbi:YhgE/Pip domain-containing protein [Streptomyces xiaopingdaonensis]|uniref:YhgE/Pip domain-containing protein n=1 Tax=Streptomyces xiaopingdaonensis TaxID=1565415 RepID=UPI0002D67F94|nr:YhgE/Pip domain-containing protein [Streptomyces xiaopingdaonensis]